MAEAGTLKCQREETRPIVADEQHRENTNKRFKLYNQVLSLLETEEDEQNLDLSSLMSTLEHELSCDYYDDSTFDSLSFTFPKNNDDLENPASASGSMNTLSSYAFRFDVLNSTWESLSPILSPRGSFACTAIPNLGRILVAGGGLRHSMFGASGSKMSSVEMYDIGKDEWVALDHSHWFFLGRCVSMLLCWHDHSVSN